VDLPAQWKEAGGWRAAQPADATERGPWWQVFGDAQLDALETRALADSPDLAQAGERLAQAQADLDIARAGLFPQVNASAGATRNRISADRPQASYAIRNSATVQNDFNVGLSVRYEADLFGANRSSARAAQASQEQARADLANARLVLTAQVAAAYFALRALDRELDVVERNAAAQRRAFDLITARHELGSASGLDLAQQQAQLDATTTQLSLLRQQRDAAEHALARLVGALASGFRLNPDATPLHPPQIALQAPAQLLERRPDIASAERAVAAANARVGVARAAWFPALTLGGGAGQESNLLSSLMSAPATLWSLGASAGVSLFDAGRIRAGVDRAWAQQRAAGDAYRAAVLGAVQEVEDGLSGTRDLGLAEEQAQAAVRSAARVDELARVRYAGGLATALDVISAEQGLLTGERTLAQVQGQRMLAAVYLVKALGGGWPGLQAARRTTAQPG
jgi:NodT family efflux transporter outer membrane factor (OMF) lipoprotein